MKIKKRILKVLSVFLALCLTLSGIGMMTGSVHAADTTFTGTINVGGSDISCTYMVTGTNTVQIGDNYHPAISTTASGAVKIPGTVTNSGTTYFVTRLGDNCFSNCNLLTDTGLGANGTVTEVGGYSFLNCEGLTDTGLGTNNTVTTLDSYAFMGCKSLANTGLGKNSTVTAIGKQCFMNCISLTDTGLGTNNTVSTLFDSCFMSCISLTDTGLGHNVKLTALPTGCFTGCRSLTNTGLGTNHKITVLGSACFSDCKGLTDTGLARNNVVTTLNSNCYLGCTSLVHAAVGSNVKFIGINSFSGDTALKDVCFYGNNPPSGSNNWICDSNTTPSLTLYYLSENSGWAGKTAADVARPSDSLKSLSKINVIGGSAAASSNYWASERGDGEWSETIGRYAQGETVALTPVYPTKLEKWESSDSTGSFSNDASTYTVGVSAGQTTSTITSTYNSCTVTFDTQGGSSVSAKTANCGAKLSEPSQPTKTGYTFAGWYADKDCKTAWNFNDDPVTGDTTIYARWTPLSYTAVFDSNGGSNVSSQPTDYGTKITRPADPLKPGYTLAGWYTDNTFTRAWDFNSDLITKDTTLCAKWKLDPVEQIITSSSFTKPYNSGMFDISATTSGNGMLTYSSDNSSVAAVSSSGIATIRGYGIADIIINASGTASYKAASKTVTITVVPPKAKIKSVSVRKYKGKYRSIKVKWTKDKTVTGYQIYMSKYSNFKKANKSVLIKKKMTVTKAFNNLNKKHKYYVKVREYVKVGGVNYYGDWSSVKSTKTR